jgi:DNA-binding transcriptional ArsR family regulator
MYEDNMYLYIICQHYINNNNVMETFMENQLSLTEVSALRESATKACSLLKALANEDRLLILCQLTQGERNVGEIEELVGIYQPTLSQQLGVLREEGIVNTCRKGKYIYYSLASFEVIQLMQTMSKLYCGKLMANIK